MKNSTLFAFIAGAAVGAAIALLTTPSTGKEMREKLKERYDEEKERKAQRAYSGSCCEDNLESINENDAQ